MGVKTATFFAMGFAIGAAYWLLSPVLFGRHEPWDYSLTLHLGVISVAGLVLGFLAEKHGWAGIAGLYVGQCLVALARPQPNPMETIPLYFALFVMATLTFPAVLSAAAGWLIRRLIPREQP